MEYSAYKPRSDWYVITLVYLGAAGLLCGFLFYDSLWGFAPAIPYLIYLYKKRKNAFVLDKKKKLREEFKNTVTGLAGALAAGYSTENAFKYVLLEIQREGNRDSIMTDELKLLINGMQCGKSLEQGLGELGEKSQIAEIKEVAYLVKISEKYGGNLIKLMGQCAKSMTEKSGTELEISTMVASKKLEGKIMGMMPFAIMLYLRLTKMPYLNILYETLFGHVFMTVCLLAMLSMVAVIDKIISRTTEQL